MSLITVEDGDLASKAAALVVPAPEEKDPWAADPEAQAPGAGRARARVASEHRD
jgi:hypothetical protein